MASANIKRAVAEADRLRKSWRAGPRPGPTIFDQARQKGIIIFRMVLDPSLSGAFIRNTRHKRDVIVVNTNHKNMHHQRFTLAHELGHLKLHGEDTGLVEGVEESDGDPKEHEANVFAAAFLVPLSEFRKAIRNHRTTPTDASDVDVVMLAAQFGVSHHVILWRLRIVAGISAGTIRKRLRRADWSHLWRLYAPDAYADTIPQQPESTWRPDGVSEETAATISRLPKTYRNLAFEAYRRGKITAGRLAEFLGITDRQALFDEIVPLLTPNTKARRNAKPPKGKDGG